MTVTVLGIRHHGPGSARSVLEELERLRPTCVLVEGPPDATAQIGIAAHPEIRPPVALLVYDTDHPSDAGFFPFAVFSPEWQAIRWALAAGVPARFMDLSYGHQLALRRARNAATATALERLAALEEGAEPDEETATALAAAAPRLREDPIGHLAEAAGEPDGERWWDRLVESRRTAGDVFDAIREAMAAVRAELPDEDPETELREAAMRREVRAAEKAGHRRIAVVCGAWHAPAIEDRPSVAHDDRLLRGLPKPVKVAAAWVPWTYARLAAESGYGAGIVSPGWYEHLWKGREPLAVTWMTRVARTFRKEDLDVSPAHLIEATRLAETLAAMRGRALPSLEELTEAIRAVVAFGSDVPLAIVRDRLIVGRAMGRVPDDAPIAPLAADLARLQKRLRLRPEEGSKSIDLDLRNANDLARSHLLHRLLLLDVPWGTPGRASGKAGTFHELWTLAWQPDFVVALIAMSRYGSTIEAAAGARVVERADAADELPVLTELVEGALLADLAGAVERVVRRVGDVAAIAADVPSLMGGLPPLARVLRYGNVRGTDAAAVRVVVDGFVTRIAVGFAPACASLDDDAAREMLPLVAGTDSAIALVDDPEHRASWQRALGLLLDQTGLHGLLAGRVTRLLLDRRTIDVSEATRRMSLTLSPGAEPPAAAAWVEGFLGESGLVLLHDEALFTVLDRWLAGLRPDAFDGVLPLLRRTVSTFPGPERRALGERVRSDRRTRAAGEGAVREPALDVERADRVLPILLRILGLPDQSETPR